MIYEWRVKSVGYHVDALFRTAHSGGASTEVPTSLEAGRIVVAALSKGDLAPADRRISLSGLRPVPA